MPWPAWDRRLRVLRIVDDFTREALALMADTSTGGRRLARARDGLIAARGRPKTIVGDNGIEMTSGAILDWRNRTGIELVRHLACPPSTGSGWGPQQNGFVESFNGRSRGRGKSAMKVHGSHTDRGTSWGQVTWCRD